MRTTNLEMKTIPTIFNSKEIRRTLHKGEWWFAVSDIVEALTDSSNGSNTIKELRQRDKELAKGWEQFIIPLVLDTPDGQQNVECTDTEGIFRLVQSIASPKAERVKSWLASVGYERMLEFEDPALVLNLTKSLYLAKGYSEAWIAKRMHSIAVRATLVDEWEKRGVGGKPEQAILATEISKTTFGLLPSEYKELKGLGHENLRDHMTDLELIFSMLGDAATTEIATKQNAQGLAENRTAARKGGRIAGCSREKLEQETGAKVVSRGNFLAEPEGWKRLTTKKV
jgi:DNA-damage-inducible protein D